MQFLNSSEQLLEDSFLFLFVPNLGNLFNTLPQMFALEGIVVIDNILYQGLLQAFLLLLFELEVFIGEQLLNHFNVVLDVLARKFLQLIKFIQH